MLPDVLIHLWQKAFAFVNLFIRYHQDKTGQLERVCGYAPRPRYSPTQRENGDIHPFLRPQRYLVPQDERIEPGRRFQDPDGTPIFR